MASGDPLVSLLLAMNIFCTLLYSVSIANIEHVIASWEILNFKRQCLDMLSKCFFS